MKGGVATCGKTDLIAHKQTYALARAREDITQGAGRSLHELILGAVGWGNEAEGGEERGSRFVLKATHDHLL